MGKGGQTFLIQHKEEAKEEESDQCPSLIIKNNIYI